MADTQLVPSPLGFVPVQQPAAGNIDVGEIGTHARQVRLDARQIGVGTDPAVGDHQRAAIGQQPDLVGADTVAGQLTETPVTVARVIPPITPSPEA